MAGIRCFAAGQPSPSTIFKFRRIHSIRCCSGVPQERNRKETPQILRLAVSGVTELLRIFSASKQDRFIRENDELSVSSVDDVLEILKSDFDNAYFVTGIFTLAIYANDCLFEDPTISFRGKKLYEQNLRLLVPFFESASVRLQNIEKGKDYGKNSVLAKWKLRTYLKLPWRPLISIDGSTVYELNDKYKIIRHAESWNISALEAVGQIFTPNFGKRGDQTESTRYTLKMHIQTISCLSELISLDFFSYTLIFFWIFGWAIDASYDHSGARNTYYRDDDAGGEPLA